MASFYDAYTKRTAENEQSGMRDLQQIGTLAQLYQTMQAKRSAAQDEQRNQAMMQEIAALPPQNRNRETVLPIVMKYARTPKDLMGALPEAPKAQPIGAGGLLRPDGTVVPPQARPEAPRPQSIGAGGLRLPDGTVVPPAARPDPTSIPVTPTKIVDPKTGKAVIVDARTGRRIGDAPPEKGVERPLPAPLQKQLTESAELADATERFTSTFKDEYGGYKLPMVGEGVNKWKLTFGDKSGQAQWWQDYELHQSQVRNKLFGSALTAPEIAAWNKSAINPGMEPGQVKENLARRAKLEKVGIDRLMKGASVVYNREQIEAFTGRQLPPARGNTQAAARASDNDPLGLR